MGSAVNGEKPISEVLLRSFHPMLYQSEDFGYHSYGKRENSSFRYTASDVAKYGTCGRSESCEENYGYSGFRNRIVITSPIMLLIAIAVKAYDRGPVFYFQDRLTIGGKPFKICKFRSMCVDSEKNGARLASKHDSRITPVGHVLRNLHLDELPQLSMCSKEICLW